MGPTLEPEADDVRRLLCILADAPRAEPEVSVSVKYGRPYRAQYGLVLPEESLTAEELVDFIAEQGWGDVVVRPEGDGYRVVQAKKLVRLG